MASNWKIFRTQRADIFSALLGGEVLSNGGREAPLLSSLGDDIALVYAEGQDQGLPAAILVSDGKRKDFFVWLETYAPQFFPVSQICRVLSVSEWQRVKNWRDVIFNTSLSRLIAGLCVGEVLAQAGGDATKVLESASLTQAHSTFSFALGRGHLLSNGNLIDRKTISVVLSEMRDSGLAPPRRVALEDVENIFSAMLGQEQTGSQFGEWMAISSVMHELAMGGSVSEASVAELSRYFQPVQLLKSMEHVSAEKRIHLFDQLSTGISSRRSSSGPAELFSVAYGAVAIGGGTTRHMNLLVEIGERNPAIWLWFGLLGSIGPDMGWHPAFARLARIVERELRYSLNLTDPPRADIFWTELVSTPSNERKSRLVEIPRSQSRVITVELAPGVTTQLGVATASIEKSNPVTTQVAVDTRPLDEAIAALWAFRTNLAGPSSVKEPLKSKAETKAKPKKRSFTKKLL